jgi:hydroxypyruvate reductase
MPPTALELRADAERIWRAGIAAVAPARLIQSYVFVDGNTLIVGEEAIDLRTVERIAIVGGGKAAGAMAAALENALGLRLLVDKRVVGWVNVPADCLVPTQRVRLHAGRPAGINEPRPEGVRGTRRILDIVSSLNPSDLCFCVLAGGGSALLPAPVHGISLEEKVQVTRLLSAAGASIEDLNNVRRCLSVIKGGGLAHACRAGRLITLVISDVLGDRLEIIASGPTFPSAATTAEEALSVLAEFGLTHVPQIAGVVQFLQQRRAFSNVSGPLPALSHYIVGNNALAVDAAGVEAERLGYRHAMISANRSEGAAETVGRQLAGLALKMRGDSGPNCLISGGEPIVALVDESLRGQGGRNQQLALAALDVLGDCEGIALLSAGTDGEDGPTDAAGAIVTQDVVRLARDLRLNSQDALRRNDAYSFFKSAGGLFLTGPTHTNVCDLRVILADQSHHH